MPDKNTALSKSDFTALDLINALPGKTARVNARANAAKGVIARKAAEALVKAGKARYLDGGLKITTDAGTDVDWEYPDGEGKPDTAEPDTTTPEADPTEPVKEPKPNGRKAAAEKSPYSTATPTNRIKRHGKSRRTGTMTEIEDGLAKGATFTVEGSGRYAVRCLSHGTSRTVPDMTTAKPLQARTDEFCGPCHSLVERGEKYVLEPKAS